MPHVRLECFLYFAGLSTFRGAILRNSLLRSGNPVYSEKLIHVERTKTNSVKKGSGKQLTQIDFKFAQFSTVVTRGNSDHTVDV